MARSLAPSLETGDTRLFLGTDTESKFSKWLDKILKGLNVVQQAILGSDICDFGTHSNRKGVATYVSSCPAGPSMISIFLRAGWSLGSVQQRYIFAGAGADQLVGRCASGLPINDNEFATLPPHFINLADLTNEDLRTCVQDYDTYPACFKPAIPFLIASIVFHREWLRVRLPGQHPLFQSRIWTSGMIGKHVSNVVTGIGRNVRSGLVATGVPPHLILAHRMVLLEAATEAVIAEVQKKHDELVLLMSTWVEELPGKVALSVLERVRVEGERPPPPLNLADLHRELEVWTTAILDRIALAAGRSGAGAAPALLDGAAVVAQEPQLERMQTWNWGGKLNHSVPMTFTMPAQPVKIMWDLWYFGNLAGVAGEKVGPYHNINSKFDLQNTTRPCRCGTKGGCACVKRFFATKAVMKALEEEAKTDMGERHPGRKLTQLSVVESDEIFRRIFDPFVTKVSRSKAGHDRRSGELLCTTLYNDILAFNIVAAAASGKVRKARAPRRKRAEEDDDENDDP